MNSYHAQDEKLNVRVQNTNARFLRAALLPFVSAVLTLFVRL